MQPDDSDSGTKTALLGGNSSRSSNNKTNNGDDEEVHEEEGVVRLLRPKINPYYRLIPIACMYFMIAFMVFPITSQVIIGIVCSQLQDGDDCSSERVSSKASLYSLYSTLAVTVPSILLAGPYGSVADRFGRKIALSLPCLGLLTMVTSVYVVSRFRPSYFLYILIGANIIMGCCGSIGIFQMGVFLYASDLTEENKMKRTSLFSLLESCTFIAKIIGPFASGLWANAFGFSSLLFGTIVMAIVCLLYSLSLPESLPSSSAIRKKALHLSPFKTFENLNAIMRFKAPNGRSPIPFIFMAVLIFLCAVIGNVSCIIFYVTHVFQWDPQTIGYYLAFEGIIQTVSMLFLPVIYDRLMKTKSLGISWLLIGYFMKCIHYMAFSLCKTTSQVFAVASLLVLTGPIPPRSRVLLSNSVPHHLQATMQSATAALDSLATFLSPLFYLIYSYSVKLENGASFVFKLFSGLCLVSFILCLYVYMSPQMYSNLPEMAMSTEEIKNPMTSHIDSNYRPIDNFNDDYNGASRGTYKTVHTNAADNDNESFNDNDDNNNVDSTATSSSTLGGRLSGGSRLGLG